MTTLLACDFAKLGRDEVGAVPIDYGAAKLFRELGMVGIAMSLFGDGLVPLMLWLSWAHPLVFFAALVVVLVAMVVLIRVLAKFLRALARRVSGWLQPSSPTV